MHSSLISSQVRDIRVNLLTDLCNKMLAGQMQSPLRLVLIPKPADCPLAPSAAIILHPLGLSEIFYRLAGRAAVRIEGSLVGPTMVPVQLGVGIPFGCQIGAKGAQCAFDFRKAVSTWDGNSALNTETRQDSFSGVFDHRPSPLTVLCMGLWTANAPVSRWDGVQLTSVKQGDPAGPLYVAVSTFPLFCSIRDAEDRAVSEYFLLMPSYTGVSAICDNLQVTSDPQLALQVAEVVQHKFTEPQP